MRYTFSVAFPVTAWTNLLRVRDRSSGAWRLLYDTYRGPIRSRIAARVSGLSESDLDDLTQTVFLQLCGEGFFERVDRTKGRFRCLVLAIADHVIDMWLRGEYAKRRKGDGAQVPLDDEAVFARAADPSTEDPTAFNREWARNIVERALESLKSESGRLGTPYFDAIRGFYFDGASYQELAGKLGVDEVQVGNYLSRGRKRLAEYIRALIQDYCRTSEELEDELRLLQEFLPGSA